MPAKGKRIKDLKQKVDPFKAYPLDEALDLLAEFKSARFDETVEAAIRLGVDPRKSDQMVRGTANLPHGTGKTVRVVVFTKGEKEQEAKDAGADYVGADDLVKKIQEEGWLEFDKAIATPDMMSQVGKLGKILGPRGMMPNPKVGTVTMDVARAVNELKGGRVEFRVDRGANIHCPVGKMSFGKDKLKENLIALYEAVQKAKPDTAKGTYIKTVYLSPTMGPGVKVDSAGLRDLMK
ncbi:MAG: 50S ribosomal protein L1 [bacterium]